MADQELSAERIQAAHRFREAEHQAAKGHLKEAIDLARDALEADPTFLEVRHWIAQQYEKSGDTRKAGIEYLEILHANHDDAVAWERLRALDPAAAERLERLHNIAPDPFVTQRTAAVDDADLDDLAGLAEELGGEEPEELVPGHEPGAEAVDSLEDLAGTDAIQGLVGEETASHHEVALEELGVSEGDEEWSLAVEPQEAPATEAAEEGAEWSLEPEETPAVEPAPEAAAEAAEEGAEWSLEPARADTVAPAPAPAVSEEELSEEPGAAPAATAAGLEPALWLYEEDLPYRDRMAQEEFIAALVPALEEFWEDNDLWDTSISGLAHLDHHRHEKVYTAFVAAGQLLGVPEWVLYFSPERRMIPTVLRGKPSVGTVTTGIMNTLNETELLFLAGRMSAMVAAGHVAFDQAAMLVLDRSPRTQTDVEGDMMELLRHHHSGVQGLHRDERKQLGVLCHAWQLRAILSADRAGLLCCRNLEAACSAIARTVAQDANAAQMASWRSLREKYAGQDLRALATIPTKEDPQRSEPYAYYRLRMLRWWAGTPQAKRLLEG